MTKPTTKKAKEPVYKKLKENQPEFVMSSGEFSGRRYQKGVPYPDSDIPVKHKCKFMTVKHIAVQPKATGEQTKPEENGK